MLISAIIGGYSGFSGNFAGLPSARSTPFMNLWIDSATCFPAATASTTVAGPETASPPAKTPSIDVANVTLSHSIVFFLVCPNVVAESQKPGSIICPMAGMMVSASTTYSEPSTGTGRRRPLASGSPNRMRTALIPLTFPPETTTSTGAARNSIFTPSSRAACTSSAKAGISALDRR